jgi:hypothetical protein
MKRLWQIKFVKVREKMKIYRVTKSSITPYTKKCWRQNLSYDTKDDGNKLSNPFNCSHTQIQEK